MGRISSMTDLSNLEMGLIIVAPTRNNKVG
jgi:hypothetical protein